MLYMVIEHFKDARAIYERFHARGRMAPAGLDYVDSWVNEDVTVCYQVMRTDDEQLLHQWAANWSDICDFEFVRVITGKEASVKVLGD